MKSPSALWRATPLPEAADGGNVVSHCHSASSGKSGMVFAYVRRSIPYRDVSGSALESSVVGLDTELP